MVRAINGGQIELYHNGTKKLQTDSAGTIFYDDTFLGDNLKANFGNNADLQLFHDGSHTYINNATGTLHIRGQGDGIRVQQTNGEDMAKFIPNGAVELYHDNTKRLETTSSGVEIPQALFVGEKIDMPDHTSGTNGMILLGTGDDLYMYHDGTNSHLRNNTGTFNVRAGNFRLTDAAIQHVYLNANGNGNDEVSLYYDNSVKLVTTNTGIEVSGEIQLDDGNPIKFGNGPDTNIHHDGSNTYIHHSGTGSLIARVVNRAFRVYGDANATIANFIDNGAVELYHNNNKKFETTSSGVDVTGTITMDAVPGTNTNAALPVLFQTSAGVIDGGSQLTYNPGGDVLKVNGLTLSSSQVRTSGNTALQLTTANANGTVDLIVRTTHVECNGHLLPATNNTDDLGSSSTRWRNIYTNDLNLSNEGGGGNDVDGTTGNYTIQEGADELYLINNKSGKKYKFNLTEVS